MISDTIYWSGGRCHQKYILASTYIRTDLPSLLYYRLFDYLFDRWLLFSFLISLFYLLYLCSILGLFFVSLEELRSLEHNRLCGAQNLLNVTTSRRETERDERRERRERRERQERHARVLMFARHNYRGEYYLEELMRVMCACLSFLVSRLYLWTSQRPSSSGKPSDEPSSTQNQVHHEHIRVIVWCGRRDNQLVCMCVRVCVV